MWPLTGLEVSNEKLLNRPAVAAKVPNLKQENPQWGLMDADILFCYPNGFAYTRLVPVFHSKYPEAVGPIRSIRPVDVPLLSPMRPLLANTGAADWVLNYFDAHDDDVERMTYLDYRGSAAFSTNRARVYKINGASQYDRAMQAHPAGMVKLAKRMKKKPPQPYLPFAASAATASTAMATAKAKTIAIPYGSGHNYDMSYRLTKDGVYARSQPWGAHVLADGTRVTVDSVLIISASWKMDKIWAGGGAQDPVIDIVKDKGTFHYCHQGRRVTGTWKKGAFSDAFTFTLKDGSALQIAPGRTFVEMPAPSADLKFT